MVLFIPCARLDMFYVQGVPLSVVKFAMYHCLDLGLYRQASTWSVDDGTRLLLLMFVTHSPTPNISPHSPKLSVIIPLVFSSSADPW